MDFNAGCASVVEKEGGSKCRGKSYAVVGSSKKWVLKGEGKAYGHRYCQSVGGDSDGQQSDTLEEFFRKEF